MNVHSSAAADGKCGLRDCGKTLKLHLSDYSQTSCHAAEGQIESLGNRVSPSFHSLVSERTPKGTI